MNNAHNREAFLDSTWMARLAQPADLLLVFDSNQEIIARHALNVSYERQ
jgi:hypothetical protein